MATTLPANIRFDATTMANPYSAQVVAGFQDAIRSATSASTPPTTWPSEIGAGAFLDGMVRLFRDGTPENLDDLSLAIASDIEAAWLELEAPD